MTQFLTRSILIRTFKIEYHMTLHLIVSVAGQSALQAHIAFGKGRIRLQPSLDHVSYLIPSHCALLGGDKALCDFFWLTEFFPNLALGIDEGNEWIIGTGAVLARYYG